MDDKSKNDETKPPRPNATTERAEVRNGGSHQRTDSASSGSSSDEPSRALGFNSITIDPTPTKKSISRSRSRQQRQRSRNRSRSGSTSRGGVAPTNMTTSSSLNNNRHRSGTSASRRGRSAGRTRSRSHTTSRDPHNSTRSSSKSSNRSKSTHSTGTHQRRLNPHPHHPRPHHQYQNQPTRTTTQTNRSTSRSSRRSPSHSRKRSSSKASRTSRTSRATVKTSASSVSSAGRRSRSCSRQSRSSSFCGGEGSIAGDISVSISPDEIEPNVHHNAIMTLEVDGPVIVEMKENELFARKAGINFTKEGGDYLTLVNSNDENSASANHDGHFESVPLSPNNYSQWNGNGNDNDNHNMLCDGSAFPPNATFLRIADGVENKTMIGSHQDLNYLRDVAGQLFVKWRGKTSPALARRLRDFQFVQEKRRKKFGHERPWGILGLYDHLAAVRADIEWAEDAACRRANGEPYKAWFEYVEEKGTGKNRPFFTYIALLICTGFLLASIAANGWKLEPFSGNPMIGPSRGTLVAMGAKSSRLIVQEKEIWRLVSAMVLHAGVIHYLLNMLALWFIGSAIEQCHGFFPAFLLFFVPAIGGTLLSAIFLPEYVTVGASSGIFGLIGACLADIFMNWNLLFNGFVNGEDNNTHRHTSVLLVLFFDIVINCLVGLTPFVDNFAHLGGMLFGFLCGTSTMARVTTDMFGDQHNETCWSTLKRNVFRFFGIIITVLSLCTALSFLMNGDGFTSPCKSCDSLSCVAFPPWGHYDNKWWYCDDCNLVTADAHFNYNTSEFEKLTLNCPAGDLVEINLDEHEYQADKDWLIAELPTFCRRHCPNLKD